MPVTGDRTQTGGNQSLSLLSVTLYDFLNYVSFWFSLIVLHKVGLTLFPAE